MTTSEQHAYVPPPEELDLDGGCAYPCEDRDGGSVVGSDGFGYCGAPEEFHVPQ